MTGREGFAAVGNTMVVVGSTCCGGPGTKRGGEGTTEGSGAPWMASREEDLCGLR